MKQKVKIKTNERTDVEFPLWRKKVDKGLFTEGTPLPYWVADMWSVPQQFSKVKRKRDSRSQVKIKFSRSEFTGYIYAKKETPNRSKVRYKLAYDDDLRSLLKHTFVMSYLRSIESSLGGVTSEKDPPFWEFLDIEYDEESRVFYFVAHYMQESYFPLLFRSLIDSYVVDRIEDEAKGKKGKAGIYKSDWLSKTKLDDELNATNVLYTLLDSKNQKIYIGETDSLRSRFSTERHEIPNWDSFRLDVLPAELAPHRRDIERLLIRSMASLIGNKKGILAKNISDYFLTNKKIDT